MITAKAKKIAIRASKKLGIGGFDVGVPGVGDGVNVGLGVAEDRVTVWMLLEPLNPYTRLFTTTHGSVGCWKRGTLGEIYWI